MSTEVQANNLPTPVSEILKKRSLEWSINNLMEVEGDSFVGPILQCLSIKYSEQVPTLGVFFNKKSRNFEMLINPQFFCVTLTDAERVAVLKHEIFHIINKHVFFDVTVLNWDKNLANIAMDLVVNQYIKGLPEGCIILDKMRDKVKKPLLKGQTVEYYYEAILDDMEMKVPNQKGQGNQEQDGNGEGESDSKGSGKGNSKGSGAGDQWVKVKDHFKNKEAGFDVHGWGEDGDPKDLLEATADLIKRAMTKVNHDYSKVPSSVRDLLEEIEAKIRTLNYKAILQSALRKSLPAKFQRLTWKKPSRRYGDQAKGRISALMPRIEVFIDTSGSISVEEANEFLNIARNFLTVGVDEAHINLFHTSNYFRKKMRRDFKLDRSEIQSGGTDLTDSFNTLKGRRCDLAIVITDGYFDMPSINTKKLPQLFFIISKGGTVNHPMNKIGKTMQYKG